MDNYLNCYHYFSDIIASSIPLPELAAAEGREHVFCSFELANTKVPDFPDNEQVHHWRMADTSEITLSFCEKNDAFLLDFPGLARFSITKTGKSITGYPLLDTPVSTIRHLLLDQFLPRIFAHFASFTVLHAGCIEINGAAICFLGDTGWGKSTMTSGFVETGGSVMTDDCTRVFYRDNTLVAQASYNSFRLLPDSIEALDINDNGGTEPTSHYSAKRTFLKPFTTESIPLSALFLLSDPNQCRDNIEAEVTVVPKTDAIIELLKNSFCFNLHDNAYLQRQFAAVSTIVASGIPVYRLSYRRDFVTLQDTIGSILHIVHQQSLT